MADPQAENGHVRIANDLVDALMRQNLSPQETGEVLQMACPENDGKDMEKAYIGIDPGKTGALALFTGDHYDVHDYPGDPAQVVETLRSWAIQYDIRLASLEKVGARPGQGVVSMFRFGQNLGAYQGILAALGIPYTMPPPRQWQAGLIDQKAGPDPKTRSLVTARRLFPNAELSRKKDHGRADALLLAFWVKRNQ